MKNQGKRICSKIASALSKKYFSAILVLIVLVGALGLTIFQSANNSGKNKDALSLQNQQPESLNNSSTILGSNVRAPQIYVSANGEGYASGGVIELASTDEPAVQIGGYNVSGTADVAVYQANDDVLLDYLTHDKDGKQLKKTPDSGKIQYITTIKKDLSSGNTGEGSKVTLPLSEKGIWYLKIKIGSTSTDAFVIRSNIGAIAKEGDNEFIFWGQNFKTKKSVTEGIVIPYNLLNGRKELERSPFNSEGIAKAKLTGDADIALIAQNDDRAIIPVNLKYLNYSYSYNSFREKVRQTKYFIFTDRPLYRPGDTVNFKAILRDDDDVRYTVPGGSASVRIYNGYYYEGSTSSPQPDFEKTYPVSEDGTVNGQYQIPADGKVGFYTLAVSIPNQTGANSRGVEYSSNTISFDVEFFKKPEFSIEVSTPKTELIAGDKTSFKIKGSYFSGQPLLNQKVKYAVYAADFYEYQYLTDQQSLAQTISNDYRYSYWYGSNKVTEGTATLNKNGEAEIDLDTRLPFAKGKTQVFSIEATIDDGSQVPAFSRRNALVYAGEYGIYRKDYTYGSKVNTPVSVPVTLVSHKSSGNVGGINLTAKLHRENWVSYQEADKKYPSYKKEEEDLPQLSAKTDSQGNAVFNFTPTKTGSYMITVEGKDSRNNPVSKIFYDYVSADDYPYYNKEGNNELTVETDKQKYQPADTVRFSIFSYVPDRDVFLSLERGRVNRFMVVHLNGKSGLVDIPLTNTDIPNIYAKVTSFDDNSLNDGQIDIPVSPESKKLVVGVTPNSKTFGPGETATVNISTTDIAGNPVSADLAIWTVDKAIFELSENRLGNIFDTFWQERGDSTQQAHSLEGITVLQGGRGGCFAAGTKVLMADGTQKNIEEIKAGDFVLTRYGESDAKLTKTKVTKTHIADESGYLIINGNLKVTANHIIWINDSWKEAGSIQIGDVLTNSGDKKIKVDSIEWQRGKTVVYNLETEKYHTYFADGIWVHNQKGGGSDRKAFKDTAYWNPSIHTDASGRAQVSFKLPDNLTTWTIAAVASTSDTRVGQTTNEIVVTKDVIVRPVLPNILRVGDEIILSALVQNFTNADHNFDISLKSDSGDVDESRRPGTQIKSNEMQQLYWKLRPTKENDKSKLTFSAQANDNNKLADILTQEIPVRPFVFEEKRAETGEGAKVFSVKPASDSHREKSKFTLSLAPTIIGTLPTAMKYLVDYPYGCVEQTTSRFVPAVIAKANQDLFKDALLGKDINDIIQKGISKLSSQQQSDGGWTWWFSGRSDPFITAYVVEYVLQAKENGAKVDDEMLKKAQGYLEQDKYYDYSLKAEKSSSREDAVAKTYGLTLLGAKSKVKKLNDFENLSPDFLSLAVMANYQNGDKNPETNGLNKLISLAKPEGDALFWEAGQKLNFGSRDASTAFAIRAITLTGGNRDLAAKGARYLTRVRKSDYWSNTFATAQVVRALVELSKTGSELTPDYSYTVLLDGKQLSEGRVTSPKQNIEDIAIPLSQIQQDGSSISITRTGNGQIYSTLLVDEFHTDRNAPAVSHGLSVKREYVNEKGEQYSLAIGDTAIVRITVGGLKANEYYGVITDELPAGLVPINQSFKNEQYGQDPYTYYYSSYDVTDREITENGEVLSLYQMAPLERTYTYKARVVSEGTFVVPPATASLMYAPEIYGRSAAEIIKIAEKSSIIPGKGVQTLPGKSNQTIRIVVLILIFLALAIFFFLRRRGNKREMPQEIMNQMQAAPIQQKKSILKSAAIITGSLSSTLVLLYLVIIIPAFLIQGLTKQEPPPPFDITPSGISFSNLPLQIIYIIGILAVPLIGSVIAYFLNGKRRTKIIYIPAIFFYLFYLLLIFSIYQINR